MADEFERDVWLRQLHAAARSSELSWPVALLLSISLGFLGVDRFYLGYGILGLLKLGTMGGCGLWWVIDILLIATGGLRDAEGGILRSGW
jgi:hypothetical protein